MAETLYRKYRPQTFAEVVGQNHIKTTLQHEIESGRLAHAYLFSGPRGLGKTTTARLLAKAVNCTQRKKGTSEPCNECDLCVDITRGRSIDVIEVDAASHTGVENVRENIIGSAQFTPTRGAFKVFIIDEVHMLSTSAFNALLKTLEEPPAHAMFILATTEIHKVPETIISRCQHFDFRKVPREEVLARLTHICTAEKKKVDAEVLEAIAYHSHGCLRDADSLLGQVLSLDDKHITQEHAELVLPRRQLALVLEMLRVLVRQDAGEALTLVNRLVQDGVNLDQFTAELIETLRIVLVTKINPSLATDDGIGSDIAREFTELVASAQRRFLIEAIEGFMSAQQQFKYADIPQLVLELAVLKLVTGSDNNEIGVGPVTSIKKITTTEPLPPLVISTPDTRTVIESATKKLAVEPESLIKKKPMTIKLSEIQQQWGAILTATKEYNHSLAAILKMSQVRSVSSDGEVEVVFGHEFHQQRMNEMKNRTILEQVLQQIFGQVLLVKPVVDTNLKLLNAQPVFEVMENQLELTSESEPGSLDSIAQAFGGKVVS